MQKLRNDGDSGLVTIPRDFLQRDDVLEEGAIPKEQKLTVDRIGERAYVVRLVDEGHIPEIEECEAIERLVAQRLLREGALTQPHGAD